MNSRVPTHPNPEPFMCVAWNCRPADLAPRPAFGFLVPCAISSPDVVVVIWSEPAAADTLHRAQAQANTLWNIIYVQQNDRKISLPCAFLFLVLGAMSAACVCRVSSSVQPAIFFVVVVVFFFFFFCCCELLLQQHSSQPPSWSTSVPLYQVSSLG